MMYETFDYGVPAGDKGTRLTPVSRLEFGNENVVLAISYAFKNYESRFESTFGDIPKIKYGTLGFSLLLRYSSEDEE